MRTINRLLLLFFVALIATVVLPVFIESAWRPDLFAILLAYVALRAPKREALGLAWAVGFAKDVSVAGSFGVHAVLWLSAAFVIVHLRAETENRPLISYVPCVAILALLSGSVDCLLMLLSGYKLAPATMARWIACSATATVLFSFPCLWLLNRLNAWLGIRRRYRFGSV